MEDNNDNNNKHKEDIGVEHCIPQYSYNLGRLSNKASVMFVIVKVKSRWNSPMELSVARD